MSVPECQVYMIHQGDQAQRQAMILAEQLRDVGVNVLVHAGSTGFKSQFKRADASGAVVAVILGETEIQERAASVKWLRASDAEQPQESIAFDQLATYLQSKV